MFCNSTTGIKFMIRNNDNERHFDFIDFHFISVKMSLIIVVLIIILLQSCFFQQLELSNNSYLIIFHISLNNSSV